MKKEQTFTIYALIDPRDDSIRYIGMTHNPDQRLKEHLRGRGGNSPKRIWINELRQLGLVPTMQPIEKGLSLPAALERESFLIQHYLNAGNVLVNLRVTPYLSYATREPPPPNVVLTRNPPGGLGCCIARRKVRLKLDDLIMEAGLRKSELARETGISISTLVRIRGGRPTTRTTMSKILRVIESRLKRSITLDIIEGINIVD